MTRKNSPKKIILILSTYIIFASVCSYYFVQPFFAERHYRDGYNFHAMKRYKYAVEDLIKACKYAPWETHYKMQLGKTYQKQAEIQKETAQKIHYYLLALNEYEKCIKIDNQNPWYKNRKAIIYQTLAQVEPNKREYYMKKAKEYNYLASENDKKNPLFQLNYAYFLHKSNDIDEAIKYYKKTITLDKDIKESYFNLADIYKKRNQLDKTMDLYLTLHKINPSIKSLNLAIATLYMNTKNYELAIPYLEKELELNTNKTDILHNLATLYYNTKRWDQSAKAFKQLIQLTPSKKTTYYQYYFQSLINTRNYTEATSALEKELKINPRNKNIQAQYKKLKQFIKSQAKNAQQKK